MATDKLGADSLLGNHSLGNHNLRTKKKNKDGNKDRCFVTTKNPTPTPAQLKSNPALEDTEYNNFVFNVLASLYRGSLRRFTQVLAEQSLV